MYYKINYVSTNSYLKKFSLKTHLMEAVPSIPGKLPKIDNGQGKKNSELWAFTHLL